MGQRAKELYLSNRWEWLLLYRSWWNKVKGLLEASRRWAYCRFTWSFYAHSRYIDIMRWYILWTKMPNYLVTPFQRKSCVSRKQSNWERVSVKIRTITNIWLEFYGTLVCTGVPKLMVLCPTILEFHQEFRNFKRLSLKMTTKDIGCSSTAQHFCQLTKECQNWRLRVEMFWNSSKRSEIPTVWPWQ